MEVSVDVIERRASFILGLTAEDKAERQNCVGASDAPIICGGDPEKVHKIWEVKCGLSEPEDLSDVLPVQLGTFTEDFNLMWFEKQTGCRVFGRKEKVIHPSLPWLRASLDGRTTHPENKQAAVVDSKHVGAFNYDGEVTLKKYAPQLAVQMMCTGYEWGLLSVLSGTQKWEWLAIERDPLYEAQVLGAIKQFWGAVQTKTPPNGISVPEPTLAVSAMRTVDLRLSNEWTSLEIDYCEHEEKAKLFETAKTGLKALVEPDVREAKGNKLCLKRDKNGSLRFSKVK